MGEFLFFTFAVLVTLHFVYEGILVPSLRLKIRYDLFALRDHVRWREIQVAGDIDHRVFAYLESHLSAGIALIPRVNAWSMFAFSRDIRGRRKAKELHGQHMDFIVKAGDQELVRIDKAISLLLFRALLVNSGAWFFYLLPIPLVLLTWRFLVYLVGRVASFPERDVVGHFLDRLVRLVGRVVALPERDVDAHFPDRSAIDANGLRAAGNA